jgi:ribonuclease III
MLQPMRVELSCEHFSPDLILSMQTKKNRNFCSSWNAVPHFEALSLHTDLKKFSKLEKKAGHVFRDKNLLLQSMLHSSFVNENRSYKLTCNERLEFLGDAVLGLIITEHLMSVFKTEDEGCLSLKRAAIVREATLAKLARRSRLQNYIIIGKGERDDTGGKREALLCDALEAFLGALYLDGGLKVVEKFILHLFQPCFDAIEHIEEHYNFKNQLQEYAQVNLKCLPHYKLASRSGPQHRQKFKIHLYLGNKYITCGSGSSIKKAEYIASKNALNLLKRRGKI